MTTPTPPKPGYKKTKIGWIPEDWEAKKIGELFKFSGGSQPPRKTFIYVPRSGFIRLIQTRDYKTNKYATYIPEKLVKKTCTKDDIMIGRYGPPIFQIFRGIEGAYNVALVKAMPNLNKLNSEYAFYFIKQENLQKYLEKLSQRSGGQTGIEMDALNKYPFPVPPLPEQQKIAQILSTWDTAIEKTRALIAAKEQHKKALMQQLLTGKTRFREFVKSEEKQQTRIGEFSNDWTLKKADEIFNNTSTKNNRNEELLAVTQENGVVPRNMLDGRVMMPDGNTNSYKLVEPGNFVISLRSFQGGIEFSNYRGIVSPAYTVLKQIIPISVEYFKYFFKSTEFISRLSIAVIGIRDGKQISFSDFSAMMFRFPSLPEQQKIATVLQTADREIKLLNQKLQALQQQKKGLMQKLLTGQVRVKISESSNS